MRLLEVDNVKEVQIFKKNLNFPVAVYICNDWEKSQFAYLTPEKHTTESLCKWCINHSIQYQILYPLRFITILKNPYKYMKFLQLKHRLG